MDKNEAIKRANEFISDLKDIQVKHNMELSSDTGDVYLAYKDSVNGPSSVSIGWIGDGTGIRVTEKTTEDIRKEALSKLTEEEINSLGL